LVLIALVAGSSSATELPAKWRNWSHFRELDAGPATTGDLLSVVIPEGLYEHSQSDLADLRVIDQGGNEIGFVIYEPGREPDSRWRNVETLDAGLVLRQYSQIVADTGESGSIHSVVEATLAPGDDEVFTWVEVAASSDRESWRIVRARAPLFRFDDDGFRGPVTIRYSQTRDRWLRLRLLDGDDRIHVEKLRVTERAAEQTPRLEISRRMRLRSDLPDDQSIWEPHGALPLMPISGVRIATAREAFHRPVSVSVSDDGSDWWQVGRGHVFRTGVEESGEAARQESLEVVFGETAAPFWRVTLMDRGDPAIDDLEVRLLRYSTSLVFKPTRTGPYRLLYGNHLAESPEYELTRLVTSDELAAADQVKLLRERANRDYLSPEPFSERHPIILWLALGVAVLVVGGLALKALR
jgi:hypothetical protein